MSVELQPQSPKNPEELKNDLQQLCALIPPVTSVWEGVGDYLAHMQAYENTDPIFRTMTEEAASRQWFDQNPSREKKRARSEHKEVLKAKLVDLSQYSTATNSYWRFVLEDFDKGYSTGIYPEIKGRSQNGGNRLVSLLDADNPEGSDLFYHDKVIHVERRAYHLFILQSIKRKELLDNIFDIENMNVIGNEEPDIEDPLTKEAWDAEFFERYGEMP
jgi:hypothetical protein